MSTPYHRKPPLAAWIQRERKRLGLKPKDVVDRLAAMNLDVSEATVKVWESNADRRPSRYNLEGLEAIFGSVAPTMAGSGGLISGMPDLADLNAALVAQADGFAKMLAFALDRDRSVEARIRLLEGEVRTLRERLGVEGPQGQSTPPQIEG